MNKTTTATRLFFAIGIPFLMLISLVLLMKSPLIETNEELSIAITVDLILTIPLIYFLFIRKTTIPKTTVVPMMIVGLAVGTYFLPNENQQYLSLFKFWILPVIELSIFTYVILKIRKARIKFRMLKESSAEVDSFSLLKNTCLEIMPKTAALLTATELAVIYYGVINWRKRKFTNNEFTHHKNSGAQALFFAFVFVIVIEAVALHFVLVRWSAVAAWILTVLSAYTALQVIGFAKSLSQRPISINENSVTLRFGILNEVEIPFSEIEGIEQSTKSIEKAPLTKTLSPIGGQDSHNIILKLNTVNQLSGLYGMKKKFKILALHIDEPNRFVEAIEIQRGELKNSTVNPEMIN